MGTMDRTGSLTDILEFIENPEPRLPCALLVDTSLSMRKNGVIGDLNRQIQVLSDKLETDYLASLRVELAVITFGDSVEVIQDFVTVDSFRPPTMDADGLTSRMGEAIRTTLNHIETRRRKYIASGISYFRPCVLMFTDGESTGEPQDSLANVLKVVKRTEEDCRIALWMIGTPNADTKQLEQLERDGNFIALKRPAFPVLFDRLVLSMRQVSRSRTDVEIALDTDGLID
ncbi:MAG: VWA domain-containing protein [Dehalococcoidia bacterium]|nr:VWA domain-containing protein [Dehalococcoidia bacterium]